MGGVETYTLHLAHALQQLGHRVHIITGEPRPTKTLAVEVQEETYQGVPVIRLIYDYERRPVECRASYSDPLVTSQIKTALQTLRPDIVHATSLSLLMAGAIEATSTLNLPLIYTATDFVLTCRRGTYVKRDNSICIEKEAAQLCTTCMAPHTALEIWLDKAWRLTPKVVAQPALSILENLAGKKADFVKAAASIEHRLNYLPYWARQIERIIAPSSYMRDMLVLNNFPPARVIVSPYGVNPPNSNSQKVPSAKLRFGYIGRITSIKGTHLLVDAFMQLAQPDQARLTIYGGAEVRSEQYIQNLQDRIKSYPNINFAGSIDNAEISQLYRQIDILVVPSLWPENSPITILEAQAHGVPVIASNAKGITDLVRHEVNGLIFTGGNTQELVTQMARCLDSPELVGRLAGQSRLVKSIHTDAENVAQIYEEVLATRL